MNNFYKKKTGRIISKVIFYLKFSDKVKQKNNNFLGTWRKREEKRPLSNLTNVLTLVSKEKKVKVLIREKEER